MESWKNKEGRHRGKLGGGQKGRKVGRDRGREEGNGGMKARGERGK